MIMASCLRCASCAALLSGTLACGHQAPPPEPPVPKPSHKAGVTLVQVAVDPLAPRVPAPREADDAEAAIIAVLDQISVLTPAEREIKGLLKQLIGQEQLELAEGADLDPLCMRLAEVLAETRSAKAKARIMSEWLLDQPEVEDLYLDDDELARAIANR